MVVESGKEGVSVGCCVDYCIKSKFDLPVRCIASSIVNGTRSRGGATSNKLFKPSLERQRSPAAEVDLACSRSPFEQDLSFALEKQNCSGKALAFFTWKFPREASTSGGVFGGRPGC